MALCEVDLYSYMVCTKNIFLNEDNTPPPAYNKNESPNKSQSLVFSFYQGWPDLDQAI